MKTRQSDRRTQRKRNDVLRQIVRTKHSLGTSNNDKPTSVVRGGNETGEAASMLAMNETPKPREVLKALRQRAGVSSTECANALGFGGGTGYLRYESDKRYDKEKLPWRIMGPVSKLFVGKGHPPITMDEILAISEVGGLSDILHPPTPPPAPAPAKLFQFPTDSSTPVIDKDLEEGHSPMMPRLPIKYRAEMGVFLSHKKTVGRQFGFAPILPTRHYDQSVQFSVSVGDDHAGDWAPPGTILHCIEPSVVSVSRFEAGRFAVAMIERGNDMFEVLVGRIETPPNSVTSPARLLVGATGTIESGLIVGIPIFKYRPL